MSYRVRVARDTAGDRPVFTAEIEGVNGGTWAASLRALDANVREAIAVTEDLDEAGEAGLVVEYVYVDETLAHAASLARELADLRAREAAYVEDLHRVMRDLTSAGFSTRDVAAVTGVTHGRVAQVLTRAS